LDWLLTPTAPRPDASAPGALGRRWRNYRWFWFRMGLNALAWPHVVDVALGTGKAEVARTPGDVVWRRGTATLTRYRPRSKASEVVVVVHSLVSRPWILDLAPGASLVESLVDQGFDVFLLDWGDPARSEAMLGLSDYSNILMHAEEEALARAHASRVHLIGYCLGGLICLLRTAARSHEHIASVALLATPVDFSIHAGLQPLVANRFFKPAYFLDGSGCIPAEGLRESFHFLRPRALRTAVGAWRRRHDPAFRHMYDPLARWVWEHRPLTGAAYLDLVRLFRTNALLNEGMTISGEIARLRDVRAPVLTLIAEHDHIVPSASSRALSRVSGISVEVAEFDTGHVSMISGGAARSTVWPTIAEWVRAHAS
jgi:polyhydroxyalkanoate synthase